MYRCGIGSHDHVLLFDVYITVRQIEGLQPDTDIHVVGCELNALEMTLPAIGFVRLCEFLQLRCAR